MRKIANLFLVLFLVSAVLVILGQMLSPFVQQDPLAGLLGLTRFSLFLLALLVYYGLGLNRHLEKSIFVPLLLFLLWGLLDYWPLESFAGSHSSLYAACGQLLIGLLALESIRRQNGESPLLLQSQFEGPGFSGANFLRFCLVSLPLVPLILLVFGYAAASSLIAEYTAGFVRLKPNGLYMIEKVYVQGEKEIRLAAMIHMAREDYYAELTASFNIGDSLLLAEGVSDKKKLLGGKFSYGKLAGLLGLSSQEQFRFPGRLIEAESLDLPITSSLGTPDILRADVDLQDFDPRSIEVLDAIGSFLLNSSSLSSGYREFSHWAEQHITPEVNQILMADLVQKRNRAVLSYFEKGLQKYRTILIPWGALHMPGLEAAVKERGFDLSESHERLSIDFLNLPYRRLVGNIVDGFGRPGM